MYIKVIAYTRSKKDEIIKKKEDTFMVFVKNKPTGNEANKKIIELLSKYFDKKANKIRIINGHHHAHKLLIIDESV